MRLLVLLVLLALVELLAWWWWWWWLASPWLVFSGATISNGSAQVTRPAASQQYFISSCSNILWGMRKYKTFRICTHIFSKLLCRDISSLAPAS
jgi:hypothetical protein